MPYPQFGAFAGLSADGRQLLAALLTAGRRPQIFSTAFFPSRAGQSGTAASALALLAQPLMERSERLPRVPIDSTVSVTGARPEDPIARAPAGVRSMTRPRM